MALENAKSKNSAVNLVRTFFTATMAEMKALTPEDRLQLASAIARQNQIPVEDLNFVPVEY